jgi:hypothetical protein
MSKKNRIWKSSLEMFTFCLEGVLLDLFLPSHPVHATQKWFTLFLGDVSEQEK